MKTLMGMAFILNKRAQEFANKNTHSITEKLYMVAWIECGIALSRDEWEMFYAKPDRVYLDSQMKYPNMNMLIEIQPTDGHPRTCIKGVQQL